MDNLLTRTAKAIHAADFAPREANWHELTDADQRHYETLAAGALSIIITDRDSQ